MLSTLLERISLSKYITNVQFGPIDRMKFFVSRKTVRLPNFFLSFLIFGFKINYTSFAVDRSSYW